MLKQADITGGERRGRPADAPSGGRHRPHLGKTRALGLDPFPVHFEIVPAAILYEFGAYLLPGRFSHWTFGKAYYQLKAEYDYGLSRIYELVINSDPCYAFLLDTNTLLQNKFVVAHVLGHSDFFKHNVWFRDTNRRMVEEVAEHARRLRRYSQDEGDPEVERFLDAVVSLAHQIDPWPRLQRPSTEGEDRGAHRSPDNGTERPREAHDPYEDLFPPGQRPWRSRRRRRRTRTTTPREPEADLLRFLLEPAGHLSEWQGDIIDIVRQETLYFVPQRMTKIMNEGWASYWHARLMRTCDLSPDEATEFARLHAAVCSPGETRINPYYLGLKIWEDIEQHFGRERLFEVRELENDASFIRLYLTRELAGELDLYLFALHEDEWKVTSKDFEEVRDAVVDSLTNLGQPYITVEDADYRGRRKCYLKPNFDSNRPVSGPSGA